MSHISPPTTLASRVCKVHDHFHYKAFVNSYHTWLCCRLQADPLQQSWDQRAPLHIAAQHHHPTVIRQLLLHPSLRTLQHATVPQQTSGQPSQHHLHQQNGSSHHHQDEDMAAAHPDGPSLQSNAMLTAEAQVVTRSHSMQEQPAEPEQDSLQDAASSLQSVYSGIHYEPYAAGNLSSSRQEDADADEHLDYTGADADAMDALLALTSDISVQSPRRPQNPAGDAFKLQVQLMSDLAEPEIMLCGLFCYAAFLFINVYCRFISTLTPHATVLGLLLLVRSAALLLGSSA